MTKEVTKTGRTGWYVRVIAGGTLIPGTAIKIVDRPNPNWPVARANDILYGRESDRMSVHELMGLEQLAREWKDSLS
jgi:MOSC domain-containing protein YiiM